MTLKDMLMKLDEVGQPSLSKMKRGGWHADVEFPSPQGVTAKVASEFDHKTPEEALQTCIDRLGGLRDMVNVPSPQVKMSHLEIEQ